MSMTDGAALPLPLSDLVAGLRERALLDVTITAGQAFGGELEAVTTPSAIDLAVRVAGADVVIVAMFYAWEASRRSFGDAIAAFVSDALG